MEIRTSVTGQRRGHTPGVGSSCGADLRPAGRHGRRRCPCRGEPHPRPARGPHRRPDVHRPARRSELGLVLRCPAASRYLPAILRAVEAAPADELHDRVPAVRSALGLIERSLPHDPGPAGAERDQAVLLDARPVEPGIRWGPHRGPVRRLPAPRQRCPRRRPRQRPRPLRDGLTGIHDA